MASGMAWTRAIPRGPHMGTASANAATFSMPETRDLEHLALALYPSAIDDTWPLLGWIEHLERCLRCRIAIVAQTWIWCASCSEVVEKPTDAPVCSLLTQPSLSSRPKSRFPTTSAAISTRRTRLESSFPTQACREYRPVGKVPKHHCAPRVGERSPETYVPADWAAQPSVAAIRVASSMSACWQHW